MQDTKPASRVRFSRGKQRRFVEDALNFSNLSLSELAKKLNICERTLRDWRREKYNISFGSLKSICRRVRMDLPHDLKILPEYWSVKKASRLGGKRYVELYGPPGTPEGRRKGGLTTQKKFRSEPGLAKRIGFIQRKKVNYPKESPALAEFVGIMLGDGGVRNDHQITVSFNPKQDLEYAHYIENLIKKLFGISSTITVRYQRNRGDIVVTSKNLVEFLDQHGIKNGNKIARQVDIPRWIWRSEKFKIACLRGLMDTDGGLYHHKYRVNGKEYVYLKMCFTSYSQPLLKSVTTILKNLKLGPKNTARHRVYLYRLAQLRRYFTIVKTSNPRYQCIYNNFVLSY